MVDDLRRESAALQVLASDGAGLSPQLAAADVEERGEEFARPVSWLRPFQGRGVDARASRGLLYGGHDCITTRNHAPVQGRRPERRIAAMNEKAARCGAVRDNALGADAEHSMRHL